MNPLHMILHLSLRCDSYHMQSNANKYEVNSIYYYQGLLYQTYYNESCDPQSLTVVVICWCCGVKDNNANAWY